jgi:hypothetical protein
MSLVRVQWEGARRILRVQTHAAQRNKTRDRRNQNLAAILKADKSPVEKVVGGWSEQQAGLGSRACPGGGSSTRRFGRAGLPTWSSCG